MSGGTQYGWDRKWIRAARNPLISAGFRQQIEDFYVEESLLGDLSGHGEHLYLFVEKIDFTTKAVQTAIAEHFCVPEIDVGYAGLKDRFAITRQWFSVRLPKGPASRKIRVPKVRVLRNGFHTAKLRHSDIGSNRFRIVLRYVSDDLDDHCLSFVPNYFGPQRFGKDGQNVSAAFKWLSEGRPRRSRFLQGMYISTLRSLLFNHVVGHRVAQNTWKQIICGDVEVMGFPSGPLWGRGRLRSTGECRTLEESLGKQFESIADALEWLGLNQERRSLVCQPQNLSMAADGPNLILEFELGAGCYATSLLQEFVEPASLGLTVGTLSEK